MIKKKKLVKYLCRQKQMETFIPTNRAKVKSLLSPPPTSSRRNEKFGSYSNED